MVQDVVVLVSLHVVVEESKFTAVDHDVFQNVRMSKLRRDLVGWQV